MARPGPINYFGINAVVTVRAGFFAAIPAANTCAAAPFGRTVASDYHPSSEESC